MKGMWAEPAAVQLTGDLVIWFTTGIETLGGIPLGGGRGAVRPENWPIYPFQVTPCIRLQALQIN